MKNHLYLQTRSEKEKGEEYEHYKALFVFVFFTTFILTIFLGPIMLFGSVFAVLLVPFSSLVGFAIVAKAIFLAAFIYWAMFRPLSVFLSKPIAFVLVCVCSAFLSVLLATIVNIDLSPPKIFVDVSNQNLGLICGSLAAAISFFVASIFVAFGR